MLLLLILYSCSVQAQEEDSVISEKPRPKNSFKKNIFLGGNLGLQFGSYTSVSASPQVGYHFGKFLEAGVGINLLYASQKYEDQNGNDYYRISYYVYGGNVFARLYPIQPVFLQIQPEYNWIQARLKYLNTTYPVEKYAAHAPSLLLGIGANIEGSIISIMYDVLQRPDAPYSKRPFLSFGIGYGFN